MKLNEYQQEAKKTAIYDEKYKIVYPVLGIVEEIDEFLVKIYDPSSPPMEEVIKEAGDVMWYLSALMSDLGLPLSCLKLDDETDITDLDTTGAKLAGKTKKWMRDKKCVVDQQFIDDMVHLASKVYTGVHSYCHQCMYPFENVLIKNIDKLRSRMERNVLTGSGDNR